MRNTNIYGLGMEPLTTISGEGLAKLKARIAELEEENAKLYVELRKDYEENENIIAGLEARIAELETENAKLLSVLQGARHLVTNIEEREKHAGATGLVERRGDASSVGESRPATGSPERGTVESGSQSSE